MSATPEQCKKYRERCKRRASDLLGRKCMFCNRTAEEHGVTIDAAHVLPTAILAKPHSRGGCHRYRDIIANPQAYRPMCRSCHKKFDLLIIQMRVTGFAMDSIKQGQEDVVPF